ncbi:MAG: hypothetical protein HY319_30350 [Armatimonadetes bacterium]|nr:hypothetical protein [Armatimonadota bacterium]
MERDGWFDRKGLDLYRTEFLASHPAWRKAAEDGRISPEELMAQHEKIIVKLRKLEPLLGRRAHEELTEILLEYEVMVNMALACQEAEIPGFLTLTGSQPPSSSSTVTR